MAMEKIFFYAIFPGFAFCCIAGGLLSWFDRKVTAWVQFRKGPPLLQPFYDVGKLMGKETLLPKYGERYTFLLSPVLALGAAVASGTLILVPAFAFHTGFTGDIIVAFYLIALPSVFYMLGAAASANPLGMLGASREMKLILGYELSFLLIVATVIYKSGMSITISGILDYQASHGPMIGSLSGIILFLAALLCVQAKLGLAPFDVSEAETEITHGIFIEYSGMAYSLIRLTRYMMLFILPCFLVILFLGGFRWEGYGILWSILKIIVAVLLITLIRNTNPRVRIDQAMRFFFVWINLAVIAAFVLAVFGL